MADRIQARAIHRAGELLKAIPLAHGANQNITDGADTKVLTRKDAAREAGLSERQQNTALRMASIPRDEFERVIESVNPPTVTGLAERGIRQREAKERREQSRNVAARRHGAAPRRLPESPGRCV
jgi:hypothetical protein